MFSLENSKRNRSIPF